MCNYKEVINAIYFMSPFSFSPSPFLLLLENCCLGKGTAEMRCQSLNDNSKTFLKMKNSCDVFLLLSKL